MKNKNNYFEDLRITLKENVRLYGMFIALAAIMLIFALLSNGLFVSPRNLSNLLDQTGYIAVLAVGMTLVIVIRHIDLSVGFVAGFIGAVAAILMTQFNIPPLVAILAVLALGIIIGLWHGFLVAFMGLPAFVATLAGMLIFRGALLLVTQGSGTIIIPSGTFNAISNGFIPDIMHIEGLHVLSLIVGLLGIAFYIYSEFKTRSNKFKYNFKVLSMGVFITKLVFIAIIILVITLVLATYQGISWTVVIVIITVAIYHIITNKTVIGRHIYAVGGNPEAAELSGINVKKITMLVFASMGLMAALAGILFAARLRSATVTAGTLFELDAIAAAYVGGTSANGGIGKVTGSVIGAIVMASLSSGMNLIGMGISLQYIVRGAVLITAVIFDIRTRGKK
ncbi:MAG: sugar ABC transporter permease [Erysipelotrichales bacterium]|nr:MAG: sugar ABC transporter permease [Erysipelotrichales bacterium]